MDGTSNAKEQLDGNRSPNATVVLSFFAICACCALSAAVGAGPGEPTTSSSLASDASSVLDKWQEIRRQPVPEFDRLIATYGCQVAMDELLRQAREGSSDLVLGDLLCAAEEDPHAKDLAIESLHSADESLRESAANWCTANLKRISPEEKESLMKLVLYRFRASKGHEGWATVNELGTSADLPTIRAVYNTSYRKQLDDRDGATSFYSCAYALPRPFPTRSAFVLLMGRLGDGDARSEIIGALEQSKDSERRCWGIILAAKLKWAGTVPLIAKALDDQTMLSEMVDQMPDEQKRRFVWQECYTRVCDVSLRAIAELAPPAKKWDFTVTPASDWAYMGGSGELPYHEYLDTIWHEDEQLYVIRNIVGFTPEQIAMARDYAAAVSKPARN